MNSNFLAIEFMNKESVKVDEIDYSVGILDKDRRQLTAYAYS
jgi:hypothetical protein